MAYCPTGALYDKMSLGKGRPGQVTKVRTTCSFCGVGCNFDLNVRNGKMVRVTSAADAPVNGMALCVKGRYGYDYVHSRGRLQRPLVRASWLEGVEERVEGGEWKVEGGEWRDPTPPPPPPPPKKKTPPPPPPPPPPKKKKKKKKTTPTPAARSWPWTGTRPWTSWRPSWQRKSGPRRRLVRHVSLGQVHQRGELLAGKAHPPGDGDQQYRPLRPPLTQHHCRRSGDHLRQRRDDQLDPRHHQDSRCIFIIGSNTSENHPVIGTKSAALSVQRGVKLIVADPRHIDIAEHADLFLRNRPGTDIALLNGIMHVIVSEGWHDESFIAERTEGFEGSRPFWRSTPQRSPEITGVPAADIGLAARIMAENRPGALVYAMGITQHKVGSPT